MSILNENGSRPEMIPYNYGLCRCGCLCCFSRRRQLQVQTEANNHEEREMLQEPLDQISLSSVDSVELDEDCEAESVGL